MSIPSLTGYLIVEVGSYEDFERGAALIAVESEFIDGSKVTFTGAGESPIKLRLPISDKCSLW